MKPVLFELKVDERLSLVIPDLSCAAEIFGLIDKDRDYLRQWLPWVDSVDSVVDTQNNLTERIESFNKQEEAAFYGMLDGEFVASVGFVDIQDTEGEIGYWLLSEYQGCGLVTRFVEACIAYGFNELHLNTIIIKCAEGNVKSAAIPQRLGFTLAEITETTRLRDGDAHHTMIFRLEVSNWKKEK